ncbi:extracellular solute-binding protein [Burkholderia stagnalis]|nr:extracellular solute-binding protein [Burkholderia stagnalis]
MMAALATAATEALARWGLQSEAVARAETNPPGLPAF